jgi:methyl-accepting chemotaxis protein
VKKNITLGTKLVTSVGILLAQILILTIVALSSIGSLSRDLHRAQTVTTAKAAMLGQLRASMSEMSAMLKGAVLSYAISDMAQFDWHKQRFERAADASKKALGGLQPLLDEPSAEKLRRALDDNHLSMMRYYGEVVQLCAQQKAAEAIELLQKRVVPEIDSVEHNASALIELDTERNTRDAAQADASSSLSRSIAWGMVLLSLAVGTPILMVVVRASRRLRELATHLANGADQLNEVASQVSTASQSLADGASQQVASLEETAASSQKLAATVRLNTESAVSAAALVSQVDQKIENANEILERMTGSMRDITVANSKISQILKAIEEIAFQTNILALNAAVEAARAGQAGAGFAVVADEVRRLAQRCSQAAGDTAKLVEESISKSNDGAVTLDQVVHAIGEITESAAKVKALVDTVKVSSQEQAVGIDDISGALGRIETVTKASAAGAGQTASASSQLDTQARDVTAIVAELHSLVGVNS